MLSDFLWKGGLYLCCLINHKAQKLGNAHYRSRALLIDYVEVCLRFLLMRQRLIILLLSSNGMFTNYANNVP